MSGLLKWLRSKLSFGSKQKPIEWYHLPAYKCILSLPFESMAPGDTNRLYHILGRMALATPPLGGPHAQREKLRLIITNDYDEDEKKEVHTLRFKTLDAALARWIVTTFPSITSLKIDVQQTGRANIEALAYLISRDSVWSNQLRNVTLIILSPEQFCAIFSLVVANCLNLEQLYVACDQKLCSPLENGAAGPEFTLSLELPKSSKLNFFFLKTPDEISITWHIQQQALLVGHESILYAFNMLIKEDFFEPLMNRVGPRLAARIIQLQLDLPLLDGMARLRAFVAKFHALTSLYLQTELKLTEILPRLIYLPKLGNLIIALECPSQLPLKRQQPQLRMEEPLTATLEGFTLIVSFMLHGVFDENYLLEQAFSSPPPWIELLFKVCLNCNCKVVHMERGEDNFSVDYSHLFRKCKLCVDPHSVLKWEPVMSNLIILNDEDM